MGTGSCVTVNSTWWLWISYLHSLRRTWWHRQRYTHPNSVRGHSPVSNMAVWVMMCAQQPFASSTWLTQLSFSQSKQALSQMAFVPASAPVWNPTMLYGLPTLNMLYVSFIGNYVKRPCHFTSWVDPYLQATWCNLAAIISNRDCNGESLPFCCRAIG